MIYFLDCCLLILLISLPLIIVRLIKGPTVMDRLLCLDTFAVTLVGIMVILSMKWKTSFYLDLILVFSTFGFLSTVAFSYYLHKTYIAHKTQSLEKNNDN